MKKIPFSINVCGEHQEQRLIFSITETDKKSVLEKPNFSITYMGIYFDHGSWSFGVDQSCIRIFYEELFAAVEGIK